MSFDLDRARTDILRDAWTEVNDTIRAQDRKASYMIALVWFLISAFSIATIKINGLQTFSHLVEILLFFPVFYLMMAAFYLFYSYYPQVNPITALRPEDREFQQNKLFILHTRNQEHSASELAEKFINDTYDFKQAVRMLYIEIIKLSKIRDRKISLIKQSSTFLILGIFSSILQFASFYKFSVYLIAVSLIALAWLVYKKKIRF